MADTEVQEQDTAEKEETLYDKIVEATGLEHGDEEGETVDEYKARLVSHFADEMSEDDFNELPDEIADWANDAIKVTKKNRGAKSKASLPSIDGLEEPKAAKKKAGRPKSEAGEKKAKEPKEKKERDPENNRFFRVAEFMLKKPEMSLDELKTAMEGKTEYSERSIMRGYEAFRGIYNAMKKHNKLA